MGAAVWLETGAGNRDRAVGIRVWLREMRLGARNRGLTVGNGPGSKEWGMGLGLGLGTRDGLC